MLTYTEAVYIFPYLTHISSCNVVIDGEVFVGKASFHLSSSHCHAVEEEELF